MGDREQEPEPGPTNENERAPGGGPLRVVAYTRVSTTGQAEEGFGLDVQSDAIATWAAANGAVITETCTDAGISGSNGIDTRFGLVDALAAVKAGKAEGVVVYRLDRWARDVIVQENLLRELTRLGGRLFSTIPTEQQQLDDPDEPTRRFVRIVLGAAAAMERDLIVARMKAGRERQRYEGRWWSGEPPYGWRTTGGGVLERNEAEQTTLAWIQRQRAAGFSWRNICDRLNEAGTPGPRGGTWHASSARRVSGRTADPPGAVVS